MQRPKSGPAGNAPRAANASLHRSCVMAKAMTYKAHSAPAVRPFGNLAVRTFHPWGASRVPRLTLTQEGNARYCGNHADARPRYLRVWFRMATEFALR